MTTKQRKMLIRIIISAVLTIILNFIPSHGYVRLMSYLVPYFVIGYDILRKAVKGICRGQVFDENFLMAVATVGAIIIAFTRSGDYNEAIGVMLFYQIGELFQSYAVGKSRRNISKLMDIRPDVAGVEQEGEIIPTAPEEVEIGTVIVVAVGERIPIDGVVIEGRSDINTVALTGESMPRPVCVGDGVISGCINMTGLLRIRTTKEYGESTVSKILDLVENASSRKSRSENFISRFARIYTPTVCLCAAALAVLPPVINILLRTTPQWSEWIYRALTFLVISCPCALVISIPLSFFAGLGGAGHEGILIKGSNYLETLSRVDSVVFDKTGTLTNGSFEVVDIHTEQNGDIDEDSFLEYAAYAESASQHPISKSLQRAYGSDIDRGRVSDVREIAGEGVIAVVDGIEVAVGSKALMTRMGVICADVSATGTAAHMAVGGVYAGYSVISDRVKETSVAAITALKDIGIGRVAMLTGDRRAVAQSVGKKLGIDLVYSELLPDGKVETVELLMSDKKGRGSLAFVGDGINDAPVLSRADVGIAMGAMGSDAAIEAADVVLMDDDPRKLVKAIKISRKCVGIVYQNTVFAIGVKLLCLVLGALGAASMWVAIFADVGVMIIAVLNAIRALFVSKL